MKHSKKIITVLVCVIALMAVTIAGTIAYLTDEEAVVNTFTVGSVDITLDEALVGDDGKAVTGDDAERVTGNEYHLVPGMEYDKDPTITIKAGSEESYVRMIMTVYNASAVQAIIDSDNAGDDAIKDYADLFAGWDETAWIYQGFETDTDANTIAFEFRYKAAVDGYDAEGNASDEVLEPLFTTLIAPQSLTTEQLQTLYGDIATDADDFRIEIVGHAIQIAGFEDSVDAETGETISAEDAAWAAFDGQMNDGTTIVGQVEVGNE